MAISVKQVMLQVRFAEINRSALYEAGLTFFTNDRFLTRTTTQQYAGPDFEGDETGNKLVFSDFLNLFLFDQKEGVGGWRTKSSRPSATRVESPSGFANGTGRTASPSPSAGPTRTQRSDTRTSRRQSGAPSGTPSPVTTSWPCRR